MYDLNYRHSFMVNKSSDSMHHQNNIYTPEIVANSNKPSDFTLTVILVSFAIAALSTYFCIKGFKRLRMVQRQLGIRS